MEYCQHFLLIKIALLKNFPLIGRLSKAMGLSSCIRTAPIPFPEASHSTIKVFVNPGVGKTSGWHIGCLRCSKAFVASRVHENASFFNNIVRGAAILP